MVVVLPICSNKHSPLYHPVSSLDWDLVIRFSPLRPLVGIKATSLSYKKGLNTWNSTQHCFFFFFNYQRFIRENPIWYKILNRDPMQFKNFTMEVKDKYELKFTDRLNKMMDNISTLQTFLDVLK